MSFESKSGTKRKFYGKRPAKTDNTTEWMAASWNKNHKEWIDVSVRACSSTGVLRLASSGKAIIKFHNQQPMKLHFVSPDHVILWRPTTTRLADGSTLTSLALPRVDRKLKWLSSSSHESKEKAVTIFWRGCPTDAAEAFEWFQTYAPKFYIRNVGLFLHAFADIATSQMDKYDMLKAWSHAEPWLVANGKTEMATVLIQSVYNKLYAERITKTQSQLPCNLFIGWDRQLVLLYLSARPLFARVFISGAEFYVKITGEVRRDVLLGYDVHFQLMEDIKIPYNEIVWLRSGSWLPSVNYHSKIRNVISLNSDGSMGVPMTCFATITILGMESLLWTRCAEYAQTLLCNWLPSDVVKFLINIYDPWNPKY